MSPKVKRVVCDPRSFQYEGTPDIPVGMTMDEYRHVTQKARHLAPVIAAVKRKLGYT